MAPSADFRMMRPKSSAVFSRSFTEMAADWVVPSISPVGWVTLLWLMAWRIVSSPTPAALAAAGSTVTRTAGCSEPATRTSATPGICAMRGATRLSAAS